MKVLKISKQFEEAIYVLIILATQSNDESLKSNVLSQLLEVSDSSLKKLLRKLVVAELIESQASKDGGFHLHKEIDQITLAEVMYAVEGQQPITYQISNLADKIFTEPAHIQRSKEFVTNGLDQAIKGFDQQLEQVYLDQLIPENRQLGVVVDWKKQTK